MINDQVTIGWKIIGLNQECITRLCKIKIYYSIGSYLEMKSGGTLRKSLYNGEESPQKFNWKVQYKINYYSNQSSSTSATFLSGNILGPEVRYCTVQNICHCNFIFCILFIKKLFLCNFFKLRIADTIFKLLLSYFTWIR